MKEDFIAGHYGAGLTREFCRAAAAVFARGRSLAGAHEAIVRRVERAELPVLYVHLSRGPDFTGASHVEPLDRFERIARREGALYLAEAPANLDATLAMWRKAVKP